MSDRGSSPVVARSLWVLCSIGLIVVSLVPGRSVPSAMLLGWDKLAHAVGYAALGAITLRTFHHRPNAAWIAIGYGLIMGVVTESLQLTAVGRTFSIADIVADVVGTLVVVLPVVMWQHRRARLGQG